MENNNNLEVGMTDYITTYSGIHIIPTRPTAEEIEIKDIAHALSYLCRGNGHLKRFFSVGQHCICCAKEAEARGHSVRVILGCLLHDAGEAYLSDIPRPLKKTMLQFYEWEESLLKVIYTKYIGSDLSEEENKLIKQIDDDLLYFDLRDLLNEPQNKETPVLAAKYEQDTRPFLEVELEYLKIFECYYQELKL